MRFLLKLLAAYTGVGLLVLAVLLIIMRPGRPRHAFWERLEAEEVRQHAR